MMTEHYYVLYQNLDRENKGFIGFVEEKEMLEFVTTIRNNGGEIYHVSYGRKIHLESESVIVWKVVDEQ